MYISKVLEFLTHEQIHEISILLSKYFPCVEAKRIEDLIFQVDSIDMAFNLLVIHSECNSTLDALVYDYLRGKDEL